MDSGKVENCFWNYEIWNFFWKLRMLHPDECVCGCISGIWKFAHLVRKHQCWKLYAGLTATYAPTSVSWKAFHLSPHTASTEKVWLHKQKSVSAKLTAVSTFHHLNTFDTLKQKEKEKKTMKNDPGLLSRLNSTSEKNGTTFPELKQLIPALRRIWTAVQRRDATQWEALLCPYFLRNAASIKFNIKINSKSK